MRVELSKGRHVFNFGEPYVIAELGANHNGDMGLAKKLIDSAKEAGADCVKFQSWSSSSLFAKVKFDENYFLKDDYRDRQDYNLEEIVDKYAISEEQLLEMKHYADNVGIDCISTPFSKREVDFLVDEMNSPFIKVASMDVNNYPFIDYLAHKGKPIVLSTGLSEVHEIDRAIRTIENAGNKQIVILHCVSIYPPDDTQINLRNIHTLQSLYPDYPIGFSDHTLGSIVTIASATLGVAVIEKHFTLDKELEGWDHKVSADPEELTQICSQTKRLVTALGTNRIAVQEDEERKKEFQRSIVTTRRLLKDQLLKKEDLDVKRPGTGLKPEYMNMLIGRKLSRDVDEDVILSMEDLY